MRPPRTRISRLLVLLAIGLGVAVSPIAPTIRAEEESPSASVECACLAADTSASPDGVIPVQLLAQGNVVDHGPPKSLLVVTSKPDPIAQVVSPAAAQAVTGVDFRTQVVVGLFVGRWPEGGSTVTIESVRATAGGVCLTALVDEGVPNARPYPYHVVAVPRDALPLSPGTAWTVVSSDGSVRAQTTFPPATTP